MDPISPSQFLAYILKHPNRTDTRFYITCCTFLLFNPQYQGMSLTDVLQDIIWSLS